MTKKELRQNLIVVLNDVAEEVRGMKPESVSDWCGTKIPNVFAYGATSERTMERNLAETSGRERKTTFMSDLSVGEWCSGVHGVLDTTKTAILSWCGNVEYIAEFILCVNWKSWEMHARQKPVWSLIYSRLYHGVVNLMYEYYDGDDESTRYLYEYLD